MPAPGADALAHSRKLSEHIHRAIHAAGGWLDFAEFMRLALYAPGLGYYSAGAEKFGAAGDFVTAPEMSPLFGRCLARACMPLFAGLREPRVLELGAGSGALAIDFLTRCAEENTLPGEYLILEVSAELRARQQSALKARLPEMQDRVRWLDALPTAFEGIILANEVMDALPVSRFVMDDDSPRALGVVSDGSQWRWASRPADAQLRRAVEAALPPDAVLPRGYRSEICRDLAPWVGGLASCLQRGALLLLDYGCERRDYYRAERSDGTLICHYRHHAHADPFLYPGLQDISAWVDFSRAAQAGQAAGLELAVYTTQAHFLLACGLLDEAAGLSAETPAEQVASAAALRRLLLPGEMGEHIKALLLTRDLPVTQLKPERDLATRL